MRGDAVTQGSICSISGCNQIKVTHVAGGKMAVNAELINKPVSVNAQLANKPVSINVGLICESSSGVWEYLWVNEGEILLIDGEKVMVRREI